MSCYPACPLASVLWVSVAFFQRRIGFTPSAEQENLGMFFFVIFLFKIRITEKLKVIP
jgi:hypothetical protein